MTVWLDAENVAEILHVSRRTALSIMYEMPHTVISGSIRKRIRVSEASLERWMIKKSNIMPVVKQTDMGSKRKLGRR